MATRSPTNHLIHIAIDAEVEAIVPNGMHRLVGLHIDEFPTSWHGIDRDALAKKIREACELGTSTGSLKRKKHKELRGYVYEITDKGRERCQN